MRNYFLIILLTVGLFTSCHNKETDFPDFDYTAVYFAYQTPVRTIVLGDDITDNTLDNQHKCRIMATMGGVYKNMNDITVGVEIDNTLCDNLKFDVSGVAGDDVLPMPSTYFSLSGTDIVIPKGSYIGGVEVQLNDAFFDDPKSVTKTYVIPLRIKSVINADSILRGKSSRTDPDCRIPSQWDFVPKDYMLYAIKYINPLDATYLRRGKDVVVGNSGNTALDNEIIYRNQYVEKDQLCKAATVAKDKVTLALKTQNKAGKDIPFAIQVEFDQDGACVVSSGDGTATYTVSGSGKFEKNGDSWGNKPRNVLRLQYDIDFGDATHSFKDTLVVRDRGVIMETFNHIVTP